MATIITILIHSQLGQVPSGALSLVFHFHLVTLFQPNQKLGSKKSDAKSQAAVRMLYQLKEYGFPLDHSFSTPSSPHPVTELQELLQKRHIRSPSYAYVPHDGTHGHMKEYTCICRVEKFNLEVKARRKNQREARKEAAEQMIQRIQQELECAKLI